MKVTIIAGARPNFMKIAPLMRAIKAAKAAEKYHCPSGLHRLDEDKTENLSVYRPGAAASRCIYCM